MVRNVVNVVGDRCMEGKWPGLNDNPPSAFESRILGRVGFKEARNIIAQTVQEERIRMPDHIDLYGNMGRMASVPNLQPPVQQTMIRNSSNMYSSGQRGSINRFIYHNPVERDHPSIYASRIDFQ